MFIEEKSKGENTKPLSEDAKIFFKAAELVESRGLCQGVSTDLLGRICCGEAIALASGQSWGNLEFYRLAVLFEPPTHEYNSRSVMCIWNNHPGRTAEEAAAKFRAVAYRV